MMIPTETLIPFFLASVLLALAPGPDNIFVLTQSALYGRLSGLYVTLGLCTGLVIHTTGVILGVAAIFQASAVAFTLLKLIGVCYLLYLAWRSFHAAATEIKTNAYSKKRFGWLYRRGIIMNVTNPKVSIFFLAFLPQFTDPDRGSISFQLALLGGLFIIATILVFGSIAWFASIVGIKLQQSHKVQILMNRIAGMVFIGIALKLAVGG